MPKCGSQASICGLPIRFDTYSGCSHGCKYCFARRDGDIDKIGTGETVIALRRFIDGWRTKETNFCDWDIPLHVGGVSDPFQPCEKEYRRTFEALKLFAETQYSFVISTKGRIVSDPEYLNLLSQCNCVVQISAVCKRYDMLEPGAPTFDERIKMVEALSGKVKRVNIRVQPYIPDVFSDVRHNMKVFANAGAYGVTLEGMKFVKRKPNTVKVAGDYCISADILRHNFSEIKDDAHKYGMRFYSGENRLRSMGDDLTCCGVDGLDGFKPNLFNACNIVNGLRIEPTKKMLEVGTAYSFKACHQNTIGSKKLDTKSFASYIKDLCNDENYRRQVLGSKI